ncbi:hypothetical protein PQX77_016994 [Marasmius sp. AFHP31]|nr:hypothetical protein PQX77_016994 [Marasmius sp. AFHP31]
MTSPRMPCRYFAQGRCKKGSSCRFSHELSSTTAHAATGARTPPPPNRNQTANHAPRGNCNFYWTTGQCNRGFECTFRHVQKPDGAEATSNSTPEEPAPADNLDFCTPAGLAEMNDIAHERDHSLTPAQAHNNIKTYTHPGFSFSVTDRVSQMVSFAKILASVDRRNSSWNSETAQAFLEILVQGKALDRVRDILGNAQVSHRAGMGFQNLSFQRGYFPVLQFLTSDLILKSTLHHNINKLYTALNDSFETVGDVVTKCMDDMIDARSWKDLTPGLPLRQQSSLSGIVVFSTLSQLLHQYFLRFRLTAVNQPKFGPLVTDMVNWFGTWSAVVTKGSASGFEDNFGPELRSITIERLRTDIGRLQEIVKRVQGSAQAKKKRPAVAKVLSAADKNQALLTRLEQSYDPPGELRANGLPRHDNDAVDVSNIRIVPTRQELLADDGPYLPVTVPGAPHHWPEGTMQRHLDIQFRLLREELIAPIRESIAVLQADFSAMSTNRTQFGGRKPTQVEQLMQKNGGVYRTTGYNSVMFQVYTNVEFSPVKAQRRELTVGLILDAPAGDARSTDRKAREEYWKRSRRLTSGGLICLVLARGANLTIYPGTVVSTNTEVAESAKTYDDQIEIRVRFFDPEVELKALRRDKAKPDHSSHSLLIDNNIMFEAIRPFLETLQTAEPTSIPFRRYISEHSKLQALQIHPPRYALSPRFGFQLECLSKNGEYIHPLNANDPASVIRARRQLRELSYLDDSQCDAMVDVLTREVALIQGPPGTGKSFTGKEILRVLFKSKVKPVVLIAFTNHALDHMLLSLLDAGITTNFVRIGSRTTDERIAEYTLDQLEQVSQQTSARRSIGKVFGEMKELEKEMVNVLRRIQIPELEWTEVQVHLEDFHPHRLTSLRQPPYWVQALMDQMFGTTSDDGQSEWEVVRKGRTRPGDKRLANTPYGFWKNGYDIDFISPPQPRATNEKQSAKRKGKEATSQQVLDDAKEAAEYQQRMTNFFVELGYQAGMAPSVPSGRRSVSDLLSDNNLSLWSLSLPERRSLAGAWEAEMRSVAYNAFLGEYNSLRVKYEAVCRRYSDVKDESRRRLLSRVDLIGCTTNGAAKLTSLLTTLAPKVLIVEEAGQVLEAHILASLVPSVEHLICIGDPQQLRPTLANYNLSMDSDRGRLLYQLDRSLMERLADNSLPMSQINIQRRMRPSISHHIRTILYPRLEDHTSVSSYPPVAGMQKDVFFFSHMHAEDGAEGAVSRTNKFEVAMIVDLVKYFLKQDAYSAPGDIAVLCAYLGQLQKVRAAMKNLQIDVALDDRDSEELEKHGIEDENPVEKVAVAKHIRLGTVDVFQGEEAKIVIVSLVRNTGTLQSENASIGFLKSSNRINVALSRAKHGMYILGNASNLRQNPTWRTIVDEMEAKDQIGFGLPISCPRHPDQTAIITEPGELSQRAPEGGSTNSMTSPLSGVPNPKRRNVWLYAAAFLPVVAVPASRDATIARRRRMLLYLNHLPIRRGCHGAPMFRTPAKERFTVSTAVVWTVHKVTNATPCAANRVDSNATITSARNLAEKIVRLAQSLVNGFAHISSAQFCADRFVLGYLATYRAKTCWNAGIDVLQKCVECLANTEKADVVDFLMQRTLAEIDLTSDETSDRLITLKCGHLFTVETLDGHCCMPDYYDIDALSGSYLSIKAPPVDFQNPPTCPTCRSPITARRYGRIVKRANLDILERNVASNMAKALEEVGPAVQAIVAELAEMKEKAKKLAYQEPTLASDEIPIDKRTKMLKENPKEVAPHGLFTGNAMNQHHGLTSTEAKGWFEIVSSLHKLYKKVASIAKTRSSHVRAYEAALATLFQLELERLGDGNEVEAIDAPEHFALDQVHKNIGQPPPKADVRYYIEAFLLSIELRFMLGEIASSRIEGLTVTSNDEKVVNHHRIWSSFVDFLYRSCEVDCRKALAIAESSSSSRLAARSATMSLCANFERIRFSLLDRRREHVRAGTFTKDTRQGLVREVLQYVQVWKHHMEMAEYTYTRSRPAYTQSMDCLSDSNWFKNNCRLKIERILREAEELGTHIARDTVYQPVSLQEKEDIVKAFGFTHRGHFYNCPNGHTFVITECGGAMQASYCPECGAAIGGSNHSLDSSNTRAREFEEISGRQGAQAGHWAWARDA